MHTLTQSLCALSIVIALLGIGFRIGNLTNATYHVANEISGHCTAAVSGRHE